jgi:uncharacterized membrane protein HdeD (DUF308 family)
MLIKKVGGLALVILGGLAVGHGSLNAQNVEIVIGLLLLAAGVLVAIAKIATRNASTSR